jgi:hypothetical protein
MRRRSDTNPTISLDKLVTGLPTAKYVMNVTVLYDDSQSRGSATDVYQRVQEVVGVESVRCTWWKLADLRQPGVLAGAVSKAIRSDMIIVAVRASEGLPLPFYFWINAWLPHHPHGLGALVAMLGAPDPGQAETGRLKKYLRVVARRARMDLLVAEGVSNGPANTTALRPISRKTSQQL